MGTCPDCGYEGSEHGVKVHFGQVHEGTLARTEECSVCSREFKPSDGRQEAVTCSILCSRVNRSEYQCRQTYARETTKMCEHCEDIFTHPPSEDPKYCCRQCADSGRVESGIIKGRNNSRWQERVVVSCSNCGESIKRIERRANEAKNFFCSGECRGEWQRDNFVDEDHPNWRREVVSCDCCSEEINVMRCRLEEFDYHFCDSDCHLEWQKNGGHSQIEGMGWGEGSFVEEVGHYVRSSWERQFALMLYQKGIEYNYEPCYDIEFQSYYPDFEIGDVVIEVKGWAQEEDIKKGQKFMEKYPEKTYVVVQGNGPRVPSDKWISWEEKDGVSWTKLVGV